MELFSVFGRILLQDDGVESKLTSVTEKAEETEGRFSGAFKKIGGAALALGGTLLAGLGLKEVFNEAEESQQALAQMDTVLKSTKDVSGMTKQSLIELAEAQSKTTEFSKTQVEQGENLLLTFTKIGKSVFPEATVACEDMATAMHMDLNSACIMIGKALQDPVKGVTTLQREGVKLSDSQKALVKSMVVTGNVAGAQKIILKELETEFGNSAKAAGETFPGQLKILKNNLVDLGAGILSNVLPPLTNFLKQINTFIGSMGKISPVTKQAIGAFAGIAVSIVPILTGMSKVKTLFNTFTSDIPKFTSKIGSIGTSISRYMSSAKKIPTFFRTAVNDTKISLGLLQDAIGAKLSPLGSFITSKLKLIVGVFHKLPAGLQVAFGKVGTGITKLITNIIPKISSGFISVGGKMISGLKTIMSIGLKAIAPAAMIATVLMGLGLLQNQMGSKLDSIAKTLITKGPQMIQQFATKLVAQITLMIKAGVTLLNNFINVLIANAPALIKAAVAIITALVNGLATNLPRLIPEIIQLIQVILQAIVQNLPLIIEAGLKIILALVQGIANNMPQIINAIVKVTITIINTLSQHLPEIIELGIQILVAIIEGLAKAIPQLIAALPQIIHAIWNGLKNVNWGQLGMAIIEGIGEGIKAAAGGLWNIVKGIGHDLLSGFKSMFGIHSPSTVMRDEVGKYIAEGVGVGIDENTDSTMASLGNMAKKMINSIGQNKNNILNAAKGLGNMDFGMNLNAKLTPVMAGDYDAADNNSNNSESPVQVIFQGNYCFMNKEMIDYFIKKAGNAFALNVQRRK